LRQRVCASERENQTEQGWASPAPAKAVWHALQRVCNPAGAQRSAVALREARSLARAHDTTDDAPPNLWRHALLLSRHLRRRCGLLRPRAAIRHACNQRVVRGQKAKTTAGKKAGGVKGKWQARW
jgi:hypothetical protein